MEKNSSEDNIVHSFDGQKGGGPKQKLLLVLGGIALLGVGSGFLLSSVSSMSSGKTENVTKASEVKKGTKIGTNDLRTFGDIAQGTMKAGGIDGEGQYHLEREGGDSQNVYLTSSTVDLSLLLDRKVKVWGQTQKAQHAGWLMDVGRVEVLE